MSKKIQFKRNTKANIPTLNEGEPFWATDEYKLYMGDGSTNHGFTSPSSYMSAAIVETSLGGFLSAMGLNAGLATYTVPTSSEISTFGATLVDDTSALAARTTLGMHFYCAADYGVKGDGTTDDFTALQSAVTAAAGHTLYVGPGNYRLAMQGTDNPSISIPSNTTILMDKHCTILSEGGDLGVNGFANAVFKNSDQVSGNTNIHIRGGRIKCNAGFEGGVFIGFYKLTRFSVKDIQLLDIDASCRAQFAHCTDGQIDDILVDWEGSPANATYSYEDGIRIESGCKRITLNNLVINSGDDAIAINNEPSSNGGSTTGADIEDITINNATVTTKAGHALRLYHYNYSGTAMIAGTIRRINVNNLTGDVAHTVDGLSIGDYSARDAIEDVTVSNLKLECTHIVYTTATPSAYGVSILNAKNVSLINPTVQNAYGYGIAVSNCPNTKIISPHIDSARSTQDGIIFGDGSDYSEVIGGRILNQGGNGITIDDTVGCTIMGVKSTDNVGWGIAETGTSDYNTAIGNVCVNCTAGSIYMIAANSLYIHTSTSAETVKLNVV